MLFIPKSLPIAFCDTDGMVLCIMWAMYAAW